MAFQPQDVKPSKAPNISLFQIKSFLGCDLTQEASNVSESRSPSCPNMVRMSAGKVMKRTGYETIATYDGAQINGHHKFFKGDEKTLFYHAGTNIFKDGTIIYSTANDTRSKSAQLNRMLCIFDGLKLLIYREKDTDGVISTELITAESIAKVPKTVISRSPTGGGKPHDPVNLITPRRTESFLGDTTSKIYQLTQSDIDELEITIVQETVNGDIDLKEGTDFTVDRKKGKITFTATKPPAVQGQDNIKITYAKTVKGYADRVNKCDICTLYGLGGAKDRLFASGNPDNINYDWYSDLNDPTMWGDVWYSVMGSDDSAIMGYSVLSDTLATHKQRDTDGTSIYLRQGKLVDNEVQFLVTGSFVGAGAVSKWAFENISDEPLYATEGDIHAVTPSDVIGNRYSQQRTYRLHGILKQLDMSQAVSCVWDNFFVFSVGGYVFLVDSTQWSVEKQAPWSTRQYECYYWTDIDARVVWVQDNVIHFGTSDGKIKRFKLDLYDPSSYNDDGVEVKAKWQISDFYGNLFYHKKNIRNVNVLMAPYVSTGVKIIAEYSGKNKLIADYTTNARIFSFKYFSFKNFAFNTNNTSRVKSKKAKIPLNGNNDRKAVITLINDRGEPFSLYEFVAEFTESR